MSRILGEPLVRWPGDGCRIQTIDRRIFPNGFGSPRISGDLGARREEDALELPGLLNERVAALQRALVPAHVISESGGCSRIYEAERVLNELEN